MERGCSCRFGVKAWRVRSSTEAGLRHMEVVSDESVHVKHPCFWLEQYAICGFIK